MDVSCFRLVVLLSRLIYTNNVIGGELSFYLYDLIRNTTSHLDIVKRLPHSKYI